MLRTPVPEAAIHENHEFLFHEKKSGFPRKETPRRQPVISCSRMSLIYTISVALLPLLLTALMIAERCSGETVSVRRGIRQRKGGCQRDERVLQTEVEAQHFRNDALDRFRIRRR